MKLVMPEDVTLRREYWRGFGNPELLRTVVMTIGVTAACALICLLCHARETPVICVFVALITAVVCVGVFSKLEGGISIYDFMKRRRRFRAEQQSFPYRYQEEVIELVAQTDKEGS